MRRGEECCLKQDNIETANPLYLALLQRGEKRQGDFSFFLDKSPLKVENTPSLLSLYDPNKLGEGIVAKIHGYIVPLTLNARGQH